MHAKLWKSAVISGGISVLTAVFLLVLAVAFSLGASDPAKQVGIWTFPILLSGGALAGGMSVRLYGEKSFLAPLLAAGLYVLVPGVSTLPFSDGFSFLNLLLKGGLSLVAAMLTGIAFGNRGSSRFGNARKAARHAGKIYKGKR